MEKTKFVRKHEIEDLLDNIVLQREIFKKNTELDYWKSTYLSIFGINNLLSLQLKHKYWKNTEIEKPLKEFKKNTTKFIHKFQHQGSQHGEWNGCSDECAELIHEYREKCIPQILQLINELDVSNDIRIKIQNEIQLVNNS